MKRMVVLVSVVSTLVAGAPLFAGEKIRDLTPREKCERVERERQRAEHDHAVGRASAERVREAKREADRVCRAADRAK